MIFPFFFISIYNPIYGTTTGLPVVRDQKMRATGSGHQETCYPSLVAGGLFRSLPSSGLVRA